MNHWNPNNVLMPGLVLDYVFNWHINKPEKQGHDSGDDSHESIAREQVELHG